MEAGRPRGFGYILFCSYKTSKNMFSKSLKQTAREYENECYMQCAPLKYLLATLK